MSGAWLAMRAPDGSLTTWPLDRPQIVIGRSAPADVVLPLPSISRQHARIDQHGQRCDLIDLGSRNGTFCNGQLVDQTPQRLHDGDQIVLGGAATLLFHDGNATIEAPRVGRLRGVWIDPHTRDVWVDAIRLDPPLSPAQFALLDLLYQQPDQIVARTAIVAAVWPDEQPDGISTEAIDGLIKRLRSRLRSGGTEYVQVLRGLGVKLIQPDP